MKQSFFVINFQKEKADITHNSWTKFENLTTVLTEEKYGLTSHMRWPYDYRIERVSYSACAYVAAVMPLSGEIMMHSSLLYTVSASKIPTATVKPRPVGTGGRKAMPSPLQTLTYLSVFPISTSAGRYGHHITTPPRFSDLPKALQPNRVGW